MFRTFTLVVTPFQQNARILYSPDTKKAAVVDPGGEAERILGVLKEHGLTLAEIWLTHSHLDHCGGVKALKDATGAVLYGHRDERVMREHIVDICEQYGLPAGDMENCPEPDQYITGGDKLALESDEFEVLFTPGHSPGHLCFHHRASETLIAGDTLFAGSIGRTDLPGGDHKLFMQTITDMLSSLPPETKVLPGHGPDTTIGQEKATNPFVTGHVF